MPTELRLWLEGVMASRHLSIHPLIPEASTRRFWRVKGSISRIAMHSPPQTENNQQFVHLSTLFRERGISVPDVIAYEPVQGFLLVTDFGTTEFLDIYSDKKLKSEAIQAALVALIELQHLPESSVPVYSAQRLHDELDIFCEWCCTKMLGCNAAPLQEIRSDMVSTIDNLPKVVLHRDYHCRNLLFENRRLGIVDFQDALFGACTYDLASLLFDCYYDHTDSDIQTWIDAYRTLVGKTSVATIKDRSGFVRAIEITAMQRQLKAVGIFCRLWLSQSKPSHLGYVMPVLESIGRLANRLEFESVSNWIRSEVKPQMQSALAEVNP